MSTQRLILPEINLLIVYHILHFTATNFVPHDVVFQLYFQLFISRRG